MNRSDLQRLAKVRAHDAKVLLDNRCYAGAYYVLGYAVECALKACIAKQIRENDFPDRKLINEAYTHDLSKLLRLSGLETEHDREKQSNKQFELYWAVVKDWTEDRRYDLNVTADQARDFRKAVVSRRNGVLSWLQKLW